MRYPINTVKDVHIVNLLLLWIHGLKFHIGVFFKTYKLYIFSSNFDINRCYGVIDTDILWVYIQVVQENLPRFS